MVLLRESFPIPAKLNANRVAWNLSSDDFPGLIRYFLRKYFGQFINPG